MHWPDCRSIVSQRLARVWCEKYCDLWVSMLCHFCLESFLFAYLPSALARRLFSALGDIHPVSSFRFFSFSLLFCLLCLLTTQRVPLRALSQPNTHTHRIFSNQFLIRTSTRVSLLTPNMAFHLSYWSLPPYMCHVAFWFSLDVVSKIISRTLFR